MLAVATLPMYHRDPFDRFLAVQARNDKLTLLTVDPVFDLYPKIKRIRAN